MPLDPNISLNVQQYDPVGAYGKAAQLGALFGQQKLQGMQIAQAERDQKNAQTMADLYKGNVNQDGSINRAGMVRGAADAGQGASIPGMTKQWGESDEAIAKVQKLKGEIGEQKFKMLTDSTKAVGSRLASVLARNQNPTEAEVMGEIGSMVRDGYFNIAAEVQGTTPDALALSRMQDMPRGNPQALRGWLVSLGAQNMEAAKLFEAVTPQLQQVNNGKVTSFVDKNPVTNPGGPAPIRMTTTPGEDLSASTSRANNAASNAVTMRGQNMTDARAGVSVEKDASGNMLIVNKSTGATRPVIGQNGKPASVGVGASDAKEALNLINQAEPLLRSSTGSYGGKAIDLLAAGFGVATPGSITAGKLRALEGALVSKMPKMSGPQSDKDVAMYRQMAGEIGNDTVPYERKLAALETIREIQERHAGMASGSSKKSSNAPSIQPQPKQTSIPGGWSVTEH